MYLSGNPIMACVAQFRLNFLLHLSVLLCITFTCAIDSHADTIDAGQKSMQCQFDEEKKTYNATDLLRCMNELAKKIILQENANPNSIVDRAYQDLRQSSYPSAAYPILANGADLPNYLGSNMLSSLLSGGLPLPNLSNLFNFGGFSRPNFNFFEALSSIAHYDDLKCVPRILCEVASGSSPGSLSYRQNFPLQDFGMNSLFGLLTAFDTTGSSPLLTFGRAALLGITNRGHSNMCYQEYSRCPRDPNQLISYLNNHNGGFFRFFNRNQGNYYRPSYQSAYRPYYKNSGNENVEYRILQTKSEYHPIQSLLGPEADRTGTGKLFFANSNYYDKESKESNFFSTNKPEESYDSSGIRFPNDYQGHQLQSNRIIKSLNDFGDFSNYYVKKEGSRTGRIFFPQDEENQNINQDYLNHEDYNRKPRLERFETKNKLYVHFPRDSIEDETHILAFPNNLRVHFNY